MKQALLLQSWFSKPNDNWFPWLSKELVKRNYNVLAPNLPTMCSKTPHLEKILKVIETKYKPNRCMTIIGHSLGCLVGMRIAEKHPFEKLILVAGWDYNDLTHEHRFFWKDKINHKKIVKNVKNIIVIHSDNDPYNTAIQAEDMSKRLHAKFSLVKSAGHFGSAAHCIEIPQILKFV